MRLELSAETESVPSAKVTCARFGGRWDGVSGTGGGAGVVACVAGRVEAAGVACGVPVDCAISDMERVRPATTANRIGAKLCMWLVGRATTAEVTRRNDALL